MARVRSWAAALAAVLIGGAALAAPVPPAPPPDPLSKAALGVQASDNGLVIGKVYPDMPAGKAGLREGDKILRVGTLHPQTFGEVVGHISSFRPGAVVEIEVERQTERKVFKVSLAPRPASFDNPNPLPPVIIDR